MKLNFFSPFYSQKQHRWCPGVKPEILDDISFTNIIRDSKVKNLVEAYQQGDKQAKTKLPAFCWTGICLEGKTRAVNTMHPSQLYMVDIDHCEDPIGCWNAIRSEIILKMNDINYGIRLAHITPSGKGLRLVAKVTKDFKTLKEHMEWLCEELSLDKYGDFDSCVKDVSRLSFAVHEDYILYRSETLFDDVEKSVISYDITSIEQGVTQNDTTPETSVSDEESHKEEYESYKDYTYRGNLVTNIIVQYLSEYGMPGDGERHNYYNTMVKYFRCICDNNVRVLHALLPRFGHGYDETLSQVQSICRTNTLSKIPREFWLFLYHNGFYEKKVTKDEKAYDDYMLNAPDKSEENITDDMPLLPPVFKEIVETMPKDFVVPAINALCPIMGTLTSHLRAVYPYDMREHSTEFFSIIYAPPSSSKGFMERWMDLLFEDLKLRDMLSNERDNLYNKMITRKGSNEKSPDNPRVTLRLVPPKQSETDFLEKQQANRGHHMFTYAAEMDSWRKGVKAAGGNKDDMIRIAWDNGEYGQNFKSANSFKGTVNLYWNVLICGTLDQINSYFTNVENGLVTRCCFTPLENQDFVDAPEFKKISKRAKQVIVNWRTRMDSENYKEPLEFDPELLFAVNDDDFDKEVPWKYEFKPNKVVDLSWVMPTIKRFLKSELEKSALDVDHARDSFRRRAAVRGFRLALLCTSLYAKLDKVAKKTITNFIKWWMPKDLERIIGLFGAKYNDKYDLSMGIKVTQKGLYESLGETFTRNDVYAAAKKLGKKTRPRQVIYDWMKYNAIVQTDKEGTYKKTNR